MNIVKLFIPMLSQPGKEVTGAINIALTCIITASVFVIFIDSVPRWIKVFRGKSVILPD